ncbi:PREDICTED: zinc finger CCCH domain-containing protein 25 [Camelina sativa]|uniref:Zinc finger CCCH domain-containing protein 25 n=1 Tax=Camelina sativa TaxID=90675 RepID=A0ABM0XU42_CAMSA|nr:PREDICTED: zinc finger CCCH domain-containing protein 25 [Camelina sativa]
MDIGWGVHRFCFSFYETIPLCHFHYIGRPCKVGAHCPYRHDPSRVVNSGSEEEELIARPRIKKRPLNQLVHPSVKTLYITGLNSSVLEQDIRDHFSPYGEIDSVRIFPHFGGTYAFLTYTTRLAAETAMEELALFTYINGQKLHLSWGPPEDELQTVCPVISTEDDDARQKIYLAALSSSFSTLPPNEWPPVESPPPHLLHSSSTKRMASLGVSTTTPGPVSR